LIGTCRNRSTTRVRTYPTSHTTAQEGPAERRFDAAYNQARQTGDLLTLELLDEAWSAAWRESAGT
jgi:hypothetical protein